MNDTRTEYRRRRQKLGLSLRAVADRMRDAGHPISQTLLWNFDKGVSKPSPEHRAAILAALNQGD